MAKIPVSIGVLYYHRDISQMPCNYDPDMMCDLVDSIEAHTDNYQLISVDNGSTINEDWIKKHSHTHHRFNRNEGISNGWNKIIELAKHEHIIILGDDTIVPPDWVEEMLKAMETPLAGMATVHVEGMPYGDGIKQSLPFPGACFMLTKKTVKTVGYFDWKTYYPCNYEDVDYQARVLAHGLKLYTNYACTVQHRMGATLHVPDLSDPYVEMGKRFIQKHGFIAEDYFYHGKDIQNVLATVDKTIIPINPDL